MRCCKKRITQEVQEIETEIAQLKTDDISKRRTELLQNAADLRRLSSSLLASEDVVGASSASIVEGLLNDLQKTKRDAEISGTERFKMDFFAQVGLRFGASSWSQRSLLRRPKHRMDHTHGKGNLVPFANSHCRKKPLL